MRLLLIIMLLVLVSGSTALAFQDGSGRSTKAPDPVSPRSPSISRSPRTAANKPPPMWHPPRQRVKPKPGSPQAKAEEWLSRGKAHYDDAANDEAIADFAKAIELVPTFAEAYYCRALALRRKGETDNAITDYSNAIKYDPEYTEAYFNRADALTSKLNFEAAVVDLTFAIGLHPIGISVIDMGNGNTYVNKMEFDEAVNVQNNGLARIYTLRGLTYDQIGNYAAAIADFERAITANPTSPSPYFRRGRVYLDHKDYDAAVRDCEKALELDPSHVNARKCTGEASDAKLKLAARIIDLTNKVNEKPTDSSVYFDRANAYLEGNDADNAIADYDKAIELKPSFSNAYFNRAWGYYKKNALDRAIEDLTRAISLNPNFPDAYCRRGLVLEAKGDIDAAIAEYSKALDINSRFGDGYLKRGTAYITKGDLNAAHNDLTTYIEKYNQINSAAYRLRALVYDKMNKPDLAEAERKIAKAKNGG